MGLNTVSSEYTRGPFANIRHGSGPLMLMAVSCAMISDVEAAALLIETANSLIQFHIGKSSLSP